MKFSKAVVRLMLLAVLIFTVVMIIIFCIKGSIPDQLVICYFAFWAGEGGALAWIKNIKTKHGRFSQQYDDYNGYDDYESSNPINSYYRRTPDEYFQKFYNGNNDIYYTGEK